MINKHHTSIVSEKAILGSNVTIGPYCIINENVKIGGLEASKAVAAFEILKSSLNFETGGNTDKAKIFFELGLANQMLGNKGEACSAYESASYGSFKQPSEYKMEFELKCESTRP